MKPHPGLTTARRSFLRIGALAGGASRERGHDFFFAPIAHSAYAGDTVVCRAVERIKKARPGLTVITDPFGWPEISAPAPP